jgi:hypothetical protein
VPLADGTGSKPEAASDQCKADAETEPTADLRGDPGGLQVQVRLAQAMQQVNARHSHGHRAEHVR